MASSGSRVCSEAASSSAKIAAVAIPISAAVRAIRMAISPRLAMRSFFKVQLFLRPLHWGVLAITVKRGRGGGSRGRGRRNDTELGQHLARVLAERRRRPHDGRALAVETERRLRGEMVLDVAAVLQRPVAAILQLRVGEQLVRRDHAGGGDTSGLQRVCAAAGVPIGGPRRYGALDLVLVQLAALHAGEPRIVGEVGAD